MRTPRADAEGWVRVDAPAKVNLRLVVLGRRADGFHALDSTILAVSLLDAVEARAEPSGGVRVVAVEGDPAGEVPRDGRNLAAHAAAAVLARARERGAAPADAGLALRLGKRVPAEAGLGGGSADAAAAAVAADAALGLGLGREELARVVAGVGSDCAFFVAAADEGLARCTGRGERVRPLAGVALDLAVLLVVPAVRCPTAEVYRALDAPPAPADEGAVDAEEPDPRAWLSRPLPELRARLRNDLERPALARFPELRRLRALLDRAGLAHARLSGSGAAFFALLADRAEAEAAARAVGAAAAAADLRLRALAVVAPARAGLFPR